MPVAGFDYLAKELKGLNDFSNHFAFFGLFAIQTIVVRM